jgi:hypothetical protein
MLMAGIPLLNLLLLLHFSWLMLSIDGCCCSGEDLLGSRM